MKILHINTLDRGGAAKACLLIHKALLRKGVDSKMLILNPTRQHEQVYVFNYWNNTKGRFHALKKGINMMLYDRKLRHRAETLPPYAGMFTFPTTIYDITNSEHYQSADLVQLNWTSGFLDEKSFFEKNNKPLVWRMADLYITGGGFHYETNAPIESFSSYVNANLAIRRDALSSANLNLNIVPISEWTSNKAEESELTKSFSRTIINCGVDLNIYKPYDNNVKSLLNLPQDKKVVLFGADSLSDSRKGMNLLMEAIKNIDKSKIQLVSFGSGKINTDESIINLGFINDERLLAMLYSTADLFITPAIEEAFGQTLIEAQACGAPVIAFNTGGGQEVITNEKNGVLVENMDVKSLQIAIETALNTEYDRNYIIQTTRDRFDIDKKAEEYINLYSRILKR